MRHSLVRRTQKALLVAVPAVLLTAGIACAGNPADLAAESLLPVPTQETQTALTRRLQVAKKDMETLRSATEHFREANEKQELLRMKKPVDDFLKKHVDNLLLQTEEDSTLETARLSAELMLMKARLLINIDRKDAAGDVVAELKKRYGTHQKMSVEFSGRATTLDDAVKLIEEDLAVSTKPEITKG